MTTPIRRLPPYVDSIRIAVDPLVMPRIPDLPSVLNPSNLMVQEERRNEELNKRFVEELERRRQLDEIRNRFLGNATPPSGIEPRVQPPQQQNLQEDDLEKALKRLEEQKRRETELFERLDRWRVPRLSELPVPPIRLPELRLSETPELPPWEWRWAFKPIPKPLPLPLPPLAVRQRHREAVPA